MAFIKMNPPLPLGWIRQQDAQTGKIFFYNTATRASQWNYPHTSITAQQPISTQGGMAEHSLPSGYIAQYDQKYGRYFYVDTLTGKSSWERPNGGNGRIGSHSISRPVGSYNPLQTSTLPRPLYEIYPRIDSTQSLDKQKPLPPGFLSQLDPSTGRIYYVNTCTGKTQWEDPRLSFSDPLLHSYQPYSSSHIPPIAQFSNAAHLNQQTLTHSHHYGILNTSPNVSPMIESKPAHSQRPQQPTNLFLKPLPAGYISAQDPSSGKTYFVNTQTGKTQLNDPRLENVNGPSENELHSFSSVGITQSSSPAKTESLLDLPMISISDNQLESLGDVFQPTAPIEINLDNLLIGESSPLHHSKASSPKPSLLESATSKSPRPSGSFTLERRKLSQSSSTNTIIIYWQKDYTELSDDNQWGAEESFFTVQEAVGYIIFDYMVSIFNLLTLINVSTIRLNKELKEAVSQLQIGNQEFSSREQQVRKSMLEVFIRELERLKISFENDRRDFISLLEHRIVRYLVFKSIPLENVSKIEQDPDFLDSFVRALSTTTLNLKDFLAQIMVVILEVYELLLQSLATKKIIFDYRYGFLFKASLKSGISEVCKQLGGSYWGRKFPPSELNPHKESKVYNLCGPSVFSWPEPITAPEILLMEYPESILLASLHIVALPVYYQAVQAMSISLNEKLDDDQLLSVLLANPPESAEVLLSKFHVSDRSKIDHLINETKANRAKLIAFASSPVTLPRTINMEIKSGSSVTLPLPSKSPMSTPATLPAPSMSPVLPSIPGQADEIPRNTRLHPFENPNKIKNWDGTDGF